MFKETKKKHVLIKAPKFCGSVIWSKKTQSNPVFFDSVLSCSVLDNLT